MRLLSYTADGAASFGVLTPDRTGWSTSRAASMA